MTHVMSMVLANGFGRVLAILDSGLQEAVVPPGVIDFDGQRTSVTEMRLAISERLENNNVLVGFHVAWTLTALSLPLPACSMVNLGAEEAYQLLCFIVSDAFQVWKTLFVERFFPTFSTLDCSLKCSPRRSEDRNVQSLPWSCQSGVTRATSVRTRSRSRSPRGSRGRLRNDLGPACASCSRQERLRICACQNVLASASRDSAASALGAAP